MKSAVIGRLIACTLVAGLVALTGPGSAAQAGQMTTTKAHPYVKVHDPAKKPGGPHLFLRYEPRYTSMEADTASQPTWLVPDDRDAKSHYHQRRARVGLFGDLGHHWAYKLQIRRDIHMREFLWYDAYATYSGWKFADVTFGQFKTPSGRLFVTPDRNVPLYERPRASKVLAADRDVGVMISDARRSGGKYGWWLGLFNGDGMNTGHNFHTFEWVGRFEYLVTPRLSLGMSLTANNNTHKTRYSTFLKKNKDPYGWLTYYKQGVMDETTWDVDAHYEDDHVRFFAGYMRKDFSAPGMNLPHSDDWYIMGGWKITCQGHPEGLELAAGYEQFDANSAVTDSLDAHFYTVGLNWRPRGPKPGGHFLDQFRVQYVWRDEQGPEVNNDGLTFEYEMKYTWP